MKKRLKNGQKVFEKFIIRITPNRAAILLQSLAGGSVGILFQHYVLRFNLGGVAGISFVYLVIFYSWIGMYVQESIRNIVRRLFSIKKSQSIVVQSLVDSFVLSVYKILVYLVSAVIIMYALKVLSSGDELTFARVCIAAGSIVVESALFGWVYTLAYKQFEKYKEKNFSNET